MSTYWNIRCLDCKDTLLFDNANHEDEDEAMAAICKHAGAIANLVELVCTTDVVLRAPWGSIDVRWIALHAGHRLVPIDEYGHLLDQCVEYVKCACGSRQRCRLALDHDGDHSLTDPGVHA